MTWPQLSQYLKGRPLTQLGQDQPPWTYQRATEQQLATPHAPLDGPRRWPKDSALPAAPQITHNPVVLSKHNMTQHEPSEPTPLQQHPHPKQPQGLHHHIWRKTSSPAIEGWHLCRASCISFVFSLFTTYYPSFCLFCSGGSQGLACRVRI